MNITGTKNKHLLALLMFIATVFLGFSTVHAQAEQHSFSLQVSPSPLVSQINPGETKTLELNIKNNGDQNEELKIETRSFSLTDNSDKVALGNSQPSNIKDWVTFEQPTFKLEPGQWFTQRMVIKTPKAAGFSYYFAVVISRKNDIKPSAGQQTIRGSVAVFTLLNVNRPDAKKQLEVAKFSSEKRVYEYLPATFKITFHNSGNTILQPYGNIFIQRTSNAKNPESVLAVNGAKNYILPATSRTLTTNWADGFPVYVETKSAANTAVKRSLQWDWSRLQKLRVGKYTAVLVGVYNDGQRDVPIQAQLTFWVIPWRLFIVLAIVLALVVIGLITIIKRGLQLTPGRKRHAIYNSKKN